MSSNYGPGKTTLWFISENTPSLEQLSFLYDLELGEIRSSRGRSTGSSYFNSSFLWSPAVRALTILFLRYKTAEKNSEEAFISGEEGTPASSLDYALGKNTAWLADMFGYNHEAVPYCKNLFIRNNPERKRPGPVTISVNPNILKQDAISVFLDGKELNSKQCLMLAEKIEEQMPVRRGSPGEFRLKTVIEKTEFKLDEGSQDESSRTILPNSESFHVFTTPIEIENRFVQCLYMRVIDRKFAFLKKGSKAWEDLCDSGTYKYYLDSLEVIQNASPLIAEYIPDRCQIIAVMPGSGVKEVTVYNECKKVKDVSLNLMDVSQDVLLNVRERNPNSPFTYFTADFMQPGVLANICDRVRRKDSGNLLTFFGHSLAAHHQAEMLQNIRSAMNEKDFVIFGVQANHDDDLVGDIVLDQLVEQYENPLFRRLNLSVLQLANIDLSLGVVEIESRKDRFFPELWLVETYFRFTKPHNVTYAGQSIPFSEGERIMLSFYYHYTRPHIEKILHGQGFKIRKIFSSNTGALEILCQI